MAGRLVKLGEPIREAISRIRFAPSSSNLLISSWDRVLRLYDVDASELRSEAALDAPLLDCCFVDESVALSAGVDCCIHRYDWMLAERETVGNHNDAVTCIEYSAETGLLISAGMDKKMMFWDMHAGTRTAGYLQTDSEVMSMSLCGHHIIVAVGTHTNVYDLRNLKGLLHSEGSSMEYKICCARSLSKKEVFAVGSVDGRVALRYLEPSRSSEMGCIFHCHPKSQDRKYHLVGINDIAFHPCYNTFITGDNSGYAIIWDAQSKKRIFEFPRYTNSVASVSYNHNGQRLATACSYVYQDIEEQEEAPQIFIYEVDDVGKPSS